MNDRTELLVDLRRQYERLCKEYPKEEDALEQIFLDLRKEIIESEETFEKQRKGCIGTILWVVMWCPEVPCLMEYEDKTEALDELRDSYEEDLLSHPQESEALDQIFQQQRQKIIEAEFIIFDGDKWRLE